MTATMWTIARDLVHQAKVAHEELARDAVVDLWYAPSTFTQRRE
jgi:hypothetical protein